MVDTTCDAPASCPAPRPPFDAYVILDFEATCEQYVRLAEPEVIEFPLVIVDAARHVVVAEFRRYVRPALRPVLSRFCTQLTDITQEMVDRSATFATVYAEALAFLRSAGLGDAAPLRSYCMVTCGDWDLKTMLPTQLRLLASQGTQIEPLPTSWRRWCNLKRFIQTANPPILPLCSNTGNSHAAMPHKAARKAGKEARPVFDLPEMLQAVGLPLRGRHHSGLDDCRNIAAILCTLLERGEHIMLPTWSSRESVGNNSTGITLLQPVAIPQLPLPELCTIASSVVDRTGQVCSYVIATNAQAMCQDTAGKTADASNVSLPAANGTGEVLQKDTKDKTTTTMVETAGHTSPTNQSHAASLCNEEARSIARSGHGSRSSNGGGGSSISRAAVVRPVVQLDRTRNPLRELFAANTELPCMSEERRLYISHYLSRVLRHNADKQGIAISRNGFAKVDELLRQPALHSRNVTCRDVAEVVARDDKQRYTLAYGTQEGDGEALYIAANQGHSLPGVEPYLRPITLAEAAAGMIAVHGTSREAWARIRACGYLSPMSRHHIHFAQCLPANEQSVIAGLRRCVEVLIYLDIAKAIASDVPVWESANHVVLTAGERGTRRLPLRYVYKVEARDTGEVLYANTPPCSPMASCSQICYTSV